MESSFHALSGLLVPCEALQIQRARDFALLVDSGVSPYARLVDCYSSNGREAVIIDVDSTVPQRPKVPVRITERLKIEFDRADSWYPDVRALRTDFPRECVLHLNLVPANQPASLCLFSEPWPEIRLRLTANMLLFRIQTWLNDSADGTLHREDQPLEPPFLAASAPLIISPRLAESIVNGAQSLQLNIVDNRMGYAFTQTRSDRIPGTKALSALVIPVVSKPHEHCIINTDPESLEELHHQMEPVGIDLLGSVQRELLILETKDALRNISFLILLLVLLRQRDADAEPEAQVAAFLCISNHAQEGGLTALARAVGLGGTGDNSKRGQNVPVMLMSVSQELTPATASLYSGYEEMELSLASVGAGAIGSQVIMQAVRGGLARWQVIDKDYLLPHNLVRHALGGAWIGHAKATALAFEANALLDQPTVQPIVADVLLPREQADAIEKAFAEAHAIVDLSASVAVARHLTHDISATSKRCSIFVSPSGKDLVFLGEDPQRDHRLDHIETQYYRAIVSDMRLSEHLLGGSHIGSCRTITSRVPQDLIGLHAAQGVRILRSWLASDSAAATIVRTEDASISCTEVAVPIGKSVPIGRLGEWDVFTDSLFLEEINRQRAELLPDETGGVLLAHVDVQRRLIYVCHQIPAPPDSERQPTMYIRGCDSLVQTYDRMQVETLGNLVYIGEWHSHPHDCACTPSRDDIDAGAWLAEKTRAASLPGIMLIAGDHGQTCWMLCSQAGDPDALIHIFLARGETP